MALPAFFLTLSNILSVPEFQLRFWNVFQLGCSSYAFTLLLWKKSSLKFDTFAIKVEENQVWLSYIFAWWCFLHVFLRHFNFNQIKVFQAFVINQTSKCQWIVESISFLTLKTSSRHTTLFQLRLCRLEVVCLLSRRHRT